MQAGHVRAFIKHIIIQLQAAVTTMIGPVLRILAIRIRNSKSAASGSGIFSRLGWRERRQLLHACLNARKRRLEVPRLESTRQSLNHDSQALEARVELGEAAAEEALRASSRRLASHGSRVPRSFFKLRPVQKKTGRQQKYSGEGIMPLSRSSYAS